MLRFFGILATCLALAHSPARGQEQEAGPRYVAIPFQGNFEALFKQRLQAAREDEPLRKLLDQIRLDPKFDPALLKQIDMENPALRAFLRGMMEKHQGGVSITPGDLDGFKKTLDKLNRPAKKSRIPSLPKEAGDFPPPPTSIPGGSPGKSRPDPLKRWIRDWVRNAEDFEVPDWLRDSPALQKGLADLKTLVDREKNPSLGGLDDLPAHLRFTDKLNLHLGDGFLEKLKNISIPDMPRVNLPRVNLGGWTLPAVPLPNLGSPGGANRGETILWAAVIGAAVILAWQIGRKLSPSGKPRTGPALLGPWPVDPAQVASRVQLVQAFDYLAVLLLGADVRTWNHRAIAGHLTAATDQAGPVEALALLYEQARYTTGPDALSFQDQLAARQHLCLLGGVPAR